MTAKTPRNTWVRQWQLLKLLPLSKSKCSTITTLTDQLRNHDFSIGPRQVERMLKILEEAGLVFRSDCKPAGWWLNSVAHRHMGGLSTGEAVAWQLVADVLKPLLPASIYDVVKPMFEEATRQLNQPTANTRPESRWLQRVAIVPPAMPLMPPSLAEDVLETVNKALMERKQLEADYRRPGEDIARTLLLHPLGLLMRGPVLYLVACAFDYSEPRIFALHRMRSARLLTGIAREPEGFRLDDYLNIGMGEFGDGHIIRLKAFIDPWLMGILTETPLSSDQQISTEKEAFLLTATVPHSWQLEWWILSLGEGMEVIEPPELRKSIRKRLKRAAKRYARKSAVPVTGEAASGMDALNPGLTSPDGAEPVQPGDGDAPQEPDSDHPPFPTDRPV